MDNFVETVPSGKPASGDAPGTARVARPAFLSFGPPDRESTQIPGVDDEAPHDALAEEALSGDPADESAHSAGEGLTYIHDPDAGTGPGPQEVDPDSLQDDTGRDAHPEPAFRQGPPQCYLLFIAMATAIGLESASDALGNDLLSTPWAHLPAETQALFNVPEGQAMARAQSLLQPFKERQDAELARKAGAGGSSLSYALGSAGQFLKKLAQNASRLTDDHIKYWQTYRQESVREEAGLALTRLESAVQRILIDSSAGAAVAQINEGYRNGLRGGNAAQCQKMVDNLRDLARRGDLDADLLAEVGRSTDAVDKALRRTAARQAETEEFSRTMAARMESLSESAGVLLAGSRTLAERVSQMVERLMEALSRFMGAGNGPAPQR